MRLVANLSMLFSRTPFLGRFDDAAQAGFDRVEFWWPRSEFAAGLTEDQVVEAVQRAGVRVAMLNFDGGDLPAGDRGLAGDPVRAAEFRANVPRALSLAERLGCAKLNALAGKADSAADGASQRALLRESISFAADASAAMGVTVLVEPLNVHETPGYLLPDVETALELIDDVSRPNVKILFDAYHVARSGDDPVAAVRQAAGRIGHVQIADLPGRHEPGTGELDFAEIFRALDAVGYADDIGLEYAPTNPGSPVFAFRQGLGEVLDEIAARNGR